MMMPLESTARSLFVPTPIVVVVPNADEMALEEMESGYEAEVISLLYAEFQLDALAMRLSARVPIQIGVKV